ncbi:MAG: tetratricopeptide repeat protein [Egibacteraceae bacterium]
MSACERPGCSGTIEDDGYCDICGLRAAMTTKVPEVDPSSVSTSLWSISGRSSAGWTSPGRGPGGGGRADALHGKLGAGLVHIPPVPYRDPTTALLEDPVVPERKRFCGTCRHEVGRSRDGRPGRTKGFCPRDGTPFSFRPKLKPGELVAGQYEVLGCLAHGGFGWIYVARDRNVNDRWVVLKGLLDTGDADAQAVAVAEKRFLAEVEHPTVVKIYNFVQHRDPASGTEVGYIVMEYIGGISLKQIAQMGGPDQRRSPMPVERVLAYGLKMLEALGFLHSRGLLYCDLKPDHVIHVGDQVRLIDLGGVCRMDQEEGDSYFTPGYQAPEVDKTGPSVASDLYAVARVMALLSFDFPGFTTYRAHHLPSPDEVEVLARHESYHRLLLRATDPDPEARFSSAEAMAQQLFGVLREVVALEKGKQQRPEPSPLFGPEPRVVGTEVVGSGGFAAQTLDRTAAALALPVPRVDRDDPQAGLLATIGVMEASEVLRVLSEIPAASVETRLRTVRARAELNDLASAAQDLDALEAQEPCDWRVIWYRGLVALVAGRFDEADEAFEAVYDAFPGEAAPKLALAACAECRGAYPRAARYCEMVWRTDHRYVSAAFGLARARLAQHDRLGAATALESLPETSNHWVRAQLAGISARVRGWVAPDPVGSDLFEAAERLGRLELDPERRGHAKAEILQAVLDWVLAGSPGANGRVPMTILGHELTERGLRLGLEQSYRELASLTSSRDERVALVDMANAVRPRSWW